MKNQEKLKFKTVINSKNAQKCKKSHKNTKNWRLSAIISNIVDVVNETQNFKKP